ncbi:TOTE conflict system archaeo-eukaryotic primase domain-containing protein, partial [Erysipelothrix inopinata]
MYRKISEKLYEKFVVNHMACAIQGKDGKYYTKYINVSSKIIESMLKSKSSMGIYQQLNGNVKWVCIDFDCKDKEYPNVELMYEEIVDDFIFKLDSLNISYLKEYSGRRGIHIWIIFDEFISKRDAYRIVSYLILDIKYDKEKYGIDLFPATPTSAGNKVGKQVKLPLSTHKMGNQSFFFENELDLKKEINIDEQSEILEKYTFQTPSQLIALLNEDSTNSQSVFKKHAIKSEKDTNISVFFREVYSILSELEPYERLFTKIKNGQLENVDYLVLYGTSTGFSSDDSFFEYLMEDNPLYNEEISRRKTNKIKQGYGILTLGSLFDRYCCKLSENLNPLDTAVDFFMRKTNDKYLMYITDIKTETEIDILSNISYTASKEKNYFFENDEVINPNIYIDFMKNQVRTNEFIVSDIEEICFGKNKHSENIEFYRYIRKEKDKDRQLVSLGYKDRILTTQLALNISYALNRFQNIKSFSYNINFSSKRYIFFNWFNSWKEYTKRINTYLEIPFFDDYALIQLDLKKFYENIDFITLSEKLNKLTVDDSVYYQLKYLVNYNEKLMYELTKSRKGVPQGPAYARIISELFIQLILDEALKNHSSSTVLRYVDDMCIICPKDDVDDMYNELKILLLKNGLPLNNNKTRIYYELSDLTEEEKRTINFGNKMSYEFNTSNENMLQTNEEKSDLISDKLSNYNIDDCSLLFSTSTDDYYKKMYFIRNAKSIFSEELGRGST